MQQVVIYNRVAAQESRARLTDYLATCREYAHQNGFQIVGEFEDVASGASLARPGLTALRRILAKTRTDAVIIYDFHC